MKFQISIPEESEVPWNWSVIFCRLLGGPRWSAISPLFTKPCLLAYTVLYLTKFLMATHGSLETWPHNGFLIITVPKVRCLIQPSRHILIIHSQRWGLMKPQTGGWAYTVPLSIFRRNSHNDPKVNHPQFFISRRFFHTHWPNLISQNTVSH